MRAPDAKAPTWAVESDVESVRWNPHDTHHFFVTTEQGFIHYHDARIVPSDSSATKAIWSLQAHNEAVSSFDVNPVIPGFLVSGSTDKEVKLWNVQSGRPGMIVSRNLGVGRVFSTTFAPDQEVGFRLAVAGSKGAVQIWDTSTNAAVRRSFADRVGSSTENVKERLVGLAEDGSESEDEEEVGGAEQVAEDDAMED
jgi:periodic tryptophan protein 1